MIKRNKITYWLYLLTVILLCCGIIFVGPTHAHYQNNIYLNTIIRASEPVISDCLVEGGQTVLLGEVSEMTAVTIRFDSGSEVYGVLECSVIDPAQEEHLTAFLSNNIVYLSNGTGYVTLFIIPAEDTTPLEQELDVDVFVSFSAGNQFLYAIFRATLPAESIESTEPEGEGPKDSEITEGEQPGEDPESGEGEDPGEDPEPGAGEDSGEDSETGEGETPGEDPETSEGENPGEDPEPGAGEDSGEDPEIGEGENPGEDPESGEGEDSREDPETGEGEDSGENPEPGEGKDPGEDPETGESEDPGEDPEPGEGEDPGEDPETGEGGNPSENPEVTEDGDYSDNGRVEEEDTGFAGGTTLFTRSFTFSLGRNSARESSAVTEGDNPIVGESLSEDANLSENEGPKPSEDKEPDEEPEPSESEEPSEGPDLSEGEDPGEEPEPSEGEEPGEDPDPSEGEELGEEPGPFEGEEPGEEPDSSEGEDPGEGPEPSEGEEPSEGSDPSEGEETGEEPDPSESEEPGEGPDPSEDEEPGEEPDPSEGEEPGEGPEPSEGEEPGEEPEPSEGEEPGEGPEPSEGEESGEEPDPSEGEEPGEGPDPSEGEESGEEPEPSEGEEPGEGPEPSEGEEPDEEPDPSEGEEPGEEPDSSEGEEPGEGPEPSEGEEPGEGPEPSEGEDPGEEPNPSEGDETTEVEKPIIDDLVLSTLTAYSKSDYLPVFISFSAEAICIDLCMLDVETEMGIEFPAYSRYSVDGGNSWYMLYFGGIITIDGIDLQNLEEAGKCILLDFSITSISASHTLGIQAMEHTEVERHFGCIETYSLDPYSSRVFSRTGEEYPVMVLGGTLTLPERGADGQRRYVLEQLVLKPNGRLDYEYVPSNCISVYFGNGTLTLSMGDTLPAAGTYRLRVEYYFQGICFAQSSHTFFVNYTGIT